MEKHLEEMYKVIRQEKNGIKPEDGTKPDLNFHLEIAKSTKNPYLADFLEYLNEKLVAGDSNLREKASVDADMPHVVQEEHQAIYDAIQQKDAELARQTMITHITNTIHGMNLKTSDLSFSDSTTFS